MLSSSFPTLLLHFTDGGFKKSRAPCRFTIAMIRFFSFSIFMYKDFSVPTERAAITAGDDLRGLGTCHQQAFWQEYRKRIPAKIRNLTEDCIACRFCPEFGVKIVIPKVRLSRIHQRKPVIAAFLREIFGITFCVCLSCQIESIYEKPKNSG